MTVAVLGRPEWIKRMGTSRFAMPLFFSTQEKKMALLAAISKAFNKIGVRVPDLPENDCKFHFSKITKKNFVSRLMTY